jgi:hypothetical protein
MPSESPREGAVELIDLTSRALTNVFELFNVVRSHMVGRMAASALHLISQVIPRSSSLRFSGCPSSRSVEEPGPTLIRVSLPIHGILVKAA